MANLKEVKGRITSVKSTQQITKAMKMVAAAKLKRSQDRITQMRPYAQKLTKIIQNVSSAENSETSNPYAVERPVNKVLLVAVTSDRGLCGAFNSSIFKKTVAHIEENFQDHKNGGTLEIMTIGQKSYEFFSKRGYKVIDKYTRIFDKLSFDNVKDAAEEIMSAFDAGEYDRVDVIFNEFKNVATQYAVVEQFLPIKEEEKEEEMVKKASVEYIYEPSRVEIFEDLIPKSLKIQFYKSILESSASEHGARMTAMDKATDNANELLKELKLTYNRTRQAAITKEILEIVGGAEALAQG